VRKDVRSETLSGKVAGLSDSKSVREEMKRLQEREAQLMQRLGDDALGRNAQTVYRDRGTGRIRDLEAEAAVSVKRDKEEDERAVRYKDWSGGLHQQAERSQRLQQDLKEMDKPLARYEDDEDRDKFLKEKELAEDPMLQFVRRKKLKEKVRQAADNGQLVLSKPIYKGPPPPPNRFAILPGYRWDGVDRSNGFEKQLLDKQAEKIAVQQDAYKWSTEDM
jgi:pre-mRNA-splicing factor CWC26